jgi:hypothetical protein
MRFAHKMTQNIVESPFVKKTLVNIANTFNA